jgi:hypothetical protein
MSTHDQLLYVVTGGGAVAIFFLFNRLVGWVLGFKLELVKVKPKASKDGKRITP